MTCPPEAILRKYQYDALDRLASDTLTDISVRKRFYCRSRLSTEVQGAVTYSLFQSGDQLLAQQRFHGAIREAILIATDQQRSVLRSVDVNAPEASAYTPYGHRSGRDEFTSLLAFNGEWRDALTGHYLLGNGYRAFNPVLMRFNSSDSFSPFGKGGVNGYAYCQGDPINNSDPTGHMILPSRVKTLVSGWLGKVRANLRVRVGESMHNYYSVGPAAIKELGIRTINPLDPMSGPGNKLGSYSTRYADEPGVRYQEYSSGVTRSTVLDPTPAQVLFDATPGSELDRIYMNPRHPQHLEVHHVHQRSSQRNISNHLSVPNPATTNTNGIREPSLVFARIDSGLGGDIPGVMPSQLLRRITSGRIPGVSPAAIQRRYPQFFFR
ncbi:MULTISPECIES: RHS repeat-associated core domain-containing protein [unclassified Pseudomonas]|jgi:RHS repeat-associated protein|uniref:RHS repeat-associated core domain-containing protein n=1 Tax=unclassified Pseudomonas TaxID=196821 RepID=UPI0009E67EC2|nr:MULTISPECIES: RHS repeat-associated core domain-containing protein [unclassified Pseudomonas]MBV7479280.1 RHS repeat-associated core domain-containing protein [Pseudomonas sp. PDM31]